MSAIPGESSTAASNGLREERGRPVGGRGEKAACPGGGRLRERDGEISAAARKIGDGATGSGPVIGVAQLRRELEQAGLLRPVAASYLAWAGANAVALAGCLGWLVLGAGDGWQILNAAVTGLLLVPAGFVAHDAGHGAVRRSAGTDARLSWLWWTLLTGLSDAWWRDKHHRHHRHTNDPARDADLYPILTYSAAEAEGARGWKRLVARHQAVALPVLLCGTRAFFQCLSLRFVMQRAPLLRRELPLMLLHHALFLALPLAVLDLALAAGFLAVSYGVTGLYMGVVFLTNHTGMPLTRDSRDGVPLVAQAAITRNVKVGVPGDWLWGGLNYQIEHHLIPDLPRASMRAAVPYVQAFCRRNGIDYCCVGPLRAWMDVVRHAHSVGAALRRRPAALFAAAKPRC